MSVFDINKDELKALKPEEAINVLLEAFYRSQSGKIKARREEAGLAADEETIRNSAKKAIDRAFHEIGSNTETQEIDDILRVIEFIEDQARNW